MPAETGPHERTVMCWPCRPQIYPGALMAEACAAHAEVARTIAGFEPVTMIAPPGSGAAAQELCGGQVDVIELAIDDSWFRDTGPIVVTDGDGGRGALDWVFNCWGDKWAPYGDDATIAGRWAAAADLDVRALPMVLEGGSVNVDGAGSAVTTTQCLMHPNRNPSMTWTEIDETVRTELGVERMLWLPYGLALDDDTDGHVDNVAAFARPGVLVVQGCDDPDEDDFVRMNVNARTAGGWLDGRGQPLEVVTIPVLPFADDGVERVCVPYVNFYVGNGFVVVPVCGHPADDDALAIIAEQYPGREVLGLDVGTILARGGGGIHCITQQLPLA
jgi:agmatine deiminase